MKAIRQRTTVHLDGRDAQDRWDDRNCATHPALWDYDHVGESLHDRHTRHRHAVLACHHCPALDLCLRLNHDGAAGVIAGKVVKG